MGEHRVRLYGTFFLIFMFATGVWWKTTETYRAPLPFEEIERWDQFLSPHFKSSDWWNLSLEIVTLLPSSAAAASSNALVAAIKREMELAVKLPENVRVESGREVKLREDVEWRELQQLASGSSWQKLDDRLLQWQKESAKEGVDTISRYTVFLIWGLADNNTTSFIGKHRHAWSLLSSSQTAEGKDAKDGEAFQRQKEDVRDLAVGLLQSYLLMTLQTERHRALLSEEELRAVGPAAEYRLSFTLLNADPGDHVYSWSFAEASSVFLEPVLHHLSSLAKFTLDSQILNYIPLQQEPRFDEGKGTHYFTSAGLSHFLQPNDLNSDFTITSQTAINFMLYVPSLRHSPLHIRYNENDEEDSPVDAFLVPRQGGIVIYNNPNETLNNTSSPSPPKHYHLSTEDLQPIISLFLSQLRQLLAVPLFFLPASNSSASPSSSSVTLLPSIHAGMSGWERDALLRKQTVRNLQGATQTLSSLNKLVRKQTHMVVHDEIGEKALHTIDALCRSIRSIPLLSSSSSQLLSRCSASSSSSQQQKEGLVEEYRAAKEALEASESAFFDDQMVSLLYFPDEHELAIYLPHFAPVFWPIAVALLWELLHFVYKLAVRQWQHRRRGRQEEGASKQEEALRQHVKAE
ncbi:GPI transamidase component [Balamuthia mandrillaris]